MKNIYHLPFIIYHFAGRKNLFITLGLLLTACCSLLTVQAQKRDNMTNEEDLIVRDAQDMDLRMKAYVKIINRRLFALTDPNAASSKQAQKDFENEWGTLRTGSLGDLFWDIQKTLDEAIAKIDDIAERDQKNPLFGKSVHILADACKEWQPQFKTFLDKATDDKDKGLILNADDSCAQVVEASSKVSKEVPKEDKKKKKT